MKLRFTLITAALAVGVTTFIVPEVSRAVSSSRPNILFILTDDQNPDTLGCFGGKVLTPTLDKLCSEGVNLIEDPIHAKTVVELQGRLKGWLAGFKRPFGEFVA